MKACKDCRHCDKTDAQETPHLWRCKAPQGFVEYMSPLTGETMKKRVLVFCENEREPYSKGCGPEGNWHEVAA